MPTSLTIQSLTSANKKRTKNINYINPDATNTELKNFSQAFLALSTDSYTEATRITEEDVNSETPTPSLTKTEGIITYDADTSAVSYNGNAQLSMILQDGSTTTIASGYELGLINDVNIVFAPSNDEYTAAVLIVPHDE